MITLQEAIIKKVNTLQFGGLTFTLHIKAEDYTKDDRDKLEQLWGDGTSLVVVMNEFGEKPIDNKPKLRQILAIKMDEYAKGIGKDIQTITDEFYTRLNIESRTELTEKQLQQEIDYYDLGIRGLQFNFI